MPGLIVNGTITRTPVATGAELVAYSGFSTSNYLEQPYNSDLDFGTGDFCVMGWVKWASTGSFGALFHRTSGATINSASSMVGIISGGTNLSAWVLGTNVVFSATKPAGVWQFLVLVRRSGVLYAYLDGVLAATASQAGSLTDTSAVTYVGGYWDGSNVVSSGCSSALLRISATAPTADQILKIYNDEKVLFQDNAACTLYGASDAVTALAHDPDTNLLHVGTSAGRSVFQGLRRVDQTSTPVTTAISAVDGLVVEQ